VVGEIEGTEEWRDFHTQEGEEYRRPSVGLFFCKEEKTGRVS
jgi:hypothetical protein